MSYCSELASGELKDLEFSKSCWQDLEFPNLAGKILNFPNLAGRILNFPNLAGKILIFFKILSARNWTNLEKNITRP